jgi:hypothetical protein
MNRYRIAITEPKSDCGVKLASGSQLFAYDNRRRWIVLCLPVTHVIPLSPRCPTKTRMKKRNVPSAPLTIITILLNLLCNGAVGFIDWLGLWRFIFLDLRKQIFSNDSAKRDVRNGNADDETNDLENAGHLWQRHATGAEKRSEKATDDDADKAATDRGDEEE